MYSEYSGHTQFICYALQMLRVQKRACVLTGLLVSATQSWERNVWNWTRFVTALLCNPNPLATGLGLGERGDLANRVLSQTVTAGKCPDVSEYPVISRFQMWPHYLPVPTWKSAHVHIRLKIWQCMFLQTRDILQFNLMSFSVKCDICCRDNALLMVWSGLGNNIMAWNSCWFLSLIPNWSNTLEL